MSGEFSPSGLVSLFCWLRYLQQRWYFCFVQVFQLMIALMVLACCDMLVKETKVLGNFRLEKLIFRFVFLHCTVHYKLYSHCTIEYTIWELMKPIFRFMFLHCTVHTLQALQPLYSRVHYLRIDELFVRILFHFYRLSHCTVQEYTIWWLMHCT